MTPWPVLFSPRVPIAALCAWLAASSAFAADPVARALAVPVTITWDGQPLRQAAAPLAQIGGCAVVIDRRIDPDTRITLEADALPLADVLDAMAAAAGAEVAVYAGHLRLVPRGNAAPLAAAETARTAELRALPQRQRDTSRTPAAWAWPDGAIPHDLLATAAAAARISLAGLDDLPHDHFPAASLPRLPFADRVDLVLAHFDRRVAWRPRPGPQGGNVVYEIVPLAPAAGATGSADPPARRAATPGVRPGPRRATPSAPAAAEVTYTLTAAAPLDDLLEMLAKRFKLTLALDAEALTRRGVAPREIVRLEIRDASRERVLDAIVKPLGLAWRIDGDRLEVSAAP